MRFSIKAALAGVVLGTAAAGSAQAGPVSYRITGKVTAVDAPLAGSFSVGQTMTARWTLDAPVFLLDTNLFSLFTSPGLVELQIGSYLATNNGAEIAGLAQFGGFDAEAYRLITAATGPAAGYSPLDIEIALTKGVGLYSGVPVTLPVDLVLTDYPVRLVVLNFGAGATVASSIDTLARIPAPPALALFGAGLLGLGMVRRRD